MRTSSEEENCLLWLFTFDNKFSDYQLYSKFFHFDEFKMPSRISLLFTHNISASSLQVLKILWNTLSKSFFSIPHSNSGIDHFILLKWGVHFRNWIHNAGIDHFILLKWGMHFRNWESMPEVNSLPMPELPSKRGRNWGSMPEVNSWLYK